jgi:protein-L-isoaspartate(D-aspartate) O-methyltransferase
MNRTTEFLLVGAVACLCAGKVSGAFSRVIYETTSPYHNIRVLDDGNFRTLCFDDALETRMSIQNPLRGHYEYTEYFHMPWLWNPQLRTVLMVGLGGGSTQSSFEHYYPGVSIESVEIDPVVVQVAKDYFNFREGARQKVHVSDGRVFLRRTPSHYDLIILDAYVKGRYGSSLPQHLATKEFFEIVRDHLTTNGIVAYNVIGTAGGWHAEIVGAIYRTLNTVFPQVYLFSCKTSQNIVLVATCARNRAGMQGLRQRARELVESGRITFPDFVERLESLQLTPPSNVMRCPVLTDDYAPVEGLSGGSVSGPGRQQSDPPSRPEAKPGPDAIGEKTDLYAQARARMVSEQIASQGRGVTNSRVLRAMGAVPRHEFVQESLRARAYSDSPLPIGHGQTISQPFIVAFMTEKLDPNSTDKVLEIGTGSGYQAAVLATLVHEVYSIEIIPDLAHRAAAVLSRLGYTNVNVRVGDGYGGWPEAAPFDAIIVTCAPENVPQSLAAQLRPGGRMIIPTGSSDDQQLVLLTKIEGKLQRRALLPVRFVPMTGQAER